MGKSQSEHKISAFGRIVTRPASVRQSLKVQHHFVVFDPRTDRARTLKPRAIRE
jgi:hypothetical protein